MSNVASGTVYLPTGVPRLDRVLGGGVPKGALVVVVGAPGSGKTTLAAQIAFAAAARGQNVLIITALSEPTTKLIAHLQTYSFYAPQLVGETVQVLSLQQILAEGLEATSDQIIAMMRQSNAQVIILDGFRGMRGDEVHATTEARTFLYRIGTILDALGVTTLITSEADPRDPMFYPEMTTADLIIGMHYGLYGVRQRRGLEIIKIRGMAPLPGLHSFTIDTDGVAIYPQLEEDVAAMLLGTDAQAQGVERSAATPDQNYALLHQRMKFDLPELDVLLAGGLSQTTSTVLAGSIGTGKTLLGLYFALAGVRRGDPVVYLTFRETLAQLQFTTDAFTIGEEFRQAIQPGGLLTIFAVPAIKVNADVIAAHLLALLDRTHAQRVVIDSLAEIERAIARGSDPARLEDYLAALLAILRERAVTPLFLKETTKVVAPTLDFSADPLAVMAENRLLLQQIPYQGGHHRVLSVLKQRYSSHDTALREFEIVAPQGFHVLGGFESAAGVLEGIQDEQEQQQQHGAQ